MFERHQAGERAIVLSPDTGAATYQEDQDEFLDLVRSAGAEVVQLLTSRHQQPNPATFVGKGKVEELAEAVEQQEADMVLVNHVLSPIQERNLERALKCRVHDRTTLILDIFAQRARTHEGKLQVELAQLRHLSTRLVRGWTHLERQKGGIGLRGPGETQLETDRRLLAERVKHLQARLDKVSSQRRQSRQSRSRSQTPQVSLVGYTNAGKSTLFNTVTGSEVYAEDQLFATLDTTARQWQLGDGVNTVLVDTVGFVKNLPHELVAAFKATLQETRDADLLLHVIDASDPLRADKIAQVQEVLQEIGADEVPQLLVYNKIDLAEVEPALRRDDEDEPSSVFISAHTGEGLPLLVEAVRERLAGREHVGELVLDAVEGNIRSRLYQLQCVEKEDHDDQGKWHIKVRLTIPTCQNLKRQFPALDHRLGAICGEQEISAS